MAYVIWFTERLEQGATELLSQLGTTREQELTNRILDAIKGAGSSGILRFKLMDNRNLNPRQMDSIADALADGRPFRILTIIDEYTRECLAIKVARSIRSDHVLECLADLFVIKGVSEHIRSDNGPEITARVVRNWLPRVGASPLFIEPGSPWENGYVESFNGKLRDEFLDREIFYTLKEAQVLIEQWRKLYNEIRPHSALGYKPAAPATMLSRSEWSSLLPLTSTTPRLAVSGLT